MTAENRTICEKYKDYIIGNIPDEQELTKFLDQIKALKGGR